jgi:ComF family protein
MSRSVMVYGGWMRRGIHLLKYENEPARAPSLAHFLATPAATLPAFDLLVPAPLHRSRHKRRGYNQAELLATELSKLIAMPAGNCLVRTRSTSQQVGLDGEQRRQNVAGAFEVQDASLVVGKRIVLVDDVMTTGSTLNACAETLVAAGAVWVGALTLAREI